MEISEGDIIKCGVQKKTDKSSYVSHGGYGKKVISISSKSYILQHFLECSLFLVVFLINYTAAYMSLSF